MSSRNINNIFKEGKLEKASTVAKYAIVQEEGKRKITRNIEFFNLQHLTKPLLSLSYKKSDFSNPDQALIIEASYSDINMAFATIITEFMIAA